jgi:simple sugar transport system permease protein
MKGNFFRLWVAPLAILLCAGFLIALSLAPFGENAWEGITTLLGGAFGSGRRLSESLVRTSPLLFTGLAVALAFRTGAFNIGAEGQFLVGALGAIAVGIHLESFPPWLAVSLTLSAAALAGGLWGGIAGVLKAWRDVPEVISTIMLNFVALHWVSALIRGPLKNTSSGLPESLEIAASAQIPRFLEGWRLHWGLPLGILLAASVHVLLTRTTLGFKMRAAGYNPEAAEYSGINPRRITVLSLLLSGGLAGLAGGIEVGAITFKVFDNLSPGYGYTAIAVALVARLNPLGVILTAFFFGALEQGAGTLQRELDVPLVMVYLVQALVILMALLLGFHRPVGAPPAEEEAA